MLGIALAILGCFAKAGADIYECHKDQQFKEWAEINYPDDPAYVGYRGRTRLKSNGRLVYDWTNRNGDKVLIDTKTQQQVYNYTQAYRNQQLAGNTPEQKQAERRAKAEGRRFCHFLSDKGQPPIYKDLETGKLCYIRCTNKLAYYASLDGEFLAFTDITSFELSKYRERYATSEKKCQVELWEEIEKQAQEVQKNPLLGNISYSI